MFESIVRRWWFQVFCLFAIILGVGASIVRIQRTYDELGGPYDNRTNGMFDFHNGVYQPALGLRNGIIPYSQRLVDEYQVTRPVPAFSPFIVALHIPLTYLPLHVAEVVYFIAIMVMMAVSAWIVAREANPHLANFIFFPMLAILVLSRSGHSTLVSGYFTMELVLGTLVAFRFAEDRPILSAVGVLFASGKPTYAIPLAIVMFARRNFRALFIGIAFSIIAAAIPLLYLASLHGSSAIIDAIRVGQENHLADPTEFPVNTWTRIDFTAIVCKWLGTNPGEIVLIGAMLPLIAWPAWKLHQLATNQDRNGVTTPSGAIAALALLTALYHHAYDSLLTCGILAGLFWANHRGFHRFGTLSKCILALFVTSPWWNFASTETVLLRLPSIPMLKETLSSVNAILLMIGLVWLLCFVPTKTVHEA
jgi:Glycosyltransferase family 87